MASARRVEQINILLRELIAEILERELQFPEGSLVTVTRVSSSEDLQYADVFVSVLGAQAEEQAVLEELTRNVGNVQHLVNRKARMRPVPRITFKIDEDEKRRERVEEILAKSERGEAPEIEM